MKNRSNNNTLEETKQLNKQSAANRSSGSYSNASMSNMTNSTTNNTLEETKRLNKQSAANKNTME